MKEAMILTDAGPLVALINPADPYHARCEETARSLDSDVIITTWPCFTETMHFLGQAGGHRYQEALWICVEWDGSKYIRLRT